MLKRAMFFAIVVSGGLWLPGAVSAQNVGAGSSVPLSPYLNLLINQGQTAGLPVYQTIVQPQLDARQSAQANASGIGRLQNQLQSGGVGGGGSSRNANPTLTKRFLNYSHYYPNIRH